MAEEQNGKDLELALIQEFLDGLRAQRKLEQNPVLKKLVELLVRVYVAERDQDASSKQAQISVIESLKNYLDVKLQGKEKRAEFEAAQAKIASLEDILKGL